MRPLTRGMAIGLAGLSLAGGTLPAPVETVTYSFKGGSDGASPQAGLIADKEGALYGTTASGGFGVGTVFKLTPPAKGQKTWTETVLYRFKGGADGASPQAGLIADKEGALYGTTASGGFGVGTVFKLTPPAEGQKTWTETVLYRFSSQSIFCSDGAQPYAGLIADKEGALYGTTSYGGSSCYGTVFKLTPPAKGQKMWTEAVLYSFSFNGGDGGLPQAGLIADKEGALYGTTALGGNALGTVFKLTPPAKGQKMWTETVLWDFNDVPDGASPVAGLISDTQGDLYGTTFYGGEYCCRGVGGGTVFKLTPPAKGHTAWTEAVLYRFKRGGGVLPFAGLIADKEGALYGTNQDTVFKLTPPAKGQTTWTEAVLYSFKGGSDGHTPQAGLIADKEGALYSTTSGGGSSGNGTVFKLTLCPEPGWSGCPAFPSME